MNKKCDKYSFEDLNRYVDNDLSESRMQEFKNHLASCPACEYQIHKLEKISSVFKANVSAQVLKINTEDLKDKAALRAGLTHKTSFGNIFASLGRNIYLKLASIAAILVISVFMFNENVLGPTGPSAIVSTVDADMASVMIIETQKEKHTIIWFTET